MNGKWKKGLAGGAALGMTALLAAGLDSRLRVVTYTVKSRKVEAPVRLAVVSDLHSCSYGAGQRNLLNAINRAAPDAVLCTGDIVDDNLPDGNAWILIYALSEKYPCYYVTGNHEIWSGKADHICKTMRMLNVTVLRGTVAIARLNGQTILLCGIDDPDAGLREEQLMGPGTIFAGGKDFSILMAHRPEDIQSYLAHPFDLIVSGHAHGGQWRIPGLLNGLYAPNQGLFPRFAGGRYEFEDTTFIVSRGLARETTCVPRFFNRPELVIIDVVPEDDSRTKQQFRETQKEI